MAPRELKKPPVATKTASSLSTSLSRQTEELRKNLRRPLGRRVSLCRPLTVQFPHFGGFLAEYSSNLSMTGMFVRSASPDRPGTLLDFEFQLVDGLVLIRGTAEIVWIREADDQTPERPPGMGMRFVRLDRASRRLIRWMVERRVQEDGRLVDLRDLVWASKLGPRGNGDLDLHEVYPFAGAAATPVKSPRRRYAVLAAALCAALLTGGFIYSSQEPTGSVAARIGPLRELASRAVGEHEEVEGPNLREAELLEALEIWAHDQSRQRVGEYLSAFSVSQQGGTNASGRAPSRHLALRTTFEVEYLSPETARVSHLQSYRSEHHRESVLTTLELTLEDERWVIREGRTEKTEAAVDSDS